MDLEEFEHIRYVVEEGVATISLNRPDRRNAWSGPMSVEYRWALHHAHTDPDVRVAILTGSGKYFCAGADTQVLHTIGGAGGKYAKESAPLPPFPDGTPPQLQHNHTAPLAISVPVIAAINGACVGAGVVLATYADLRWASSGAKFASSFASLGLPAEYGLGWMLPRMLGTARALEFLYDPSLRSADELMNVGFVQRVVADEELIDSVTNYARKLARHSSADSLRSMKRAVLSDDTATLDEAYRSSVAAMEQAFVSADFRLGISAIRQKKRADFLKGE
jgi:enoyl-CoA hydratase/carnithine racemase